MQKKKRELKIKISEILIENINQEMFLKNWNKLKSESVNFESLNKINLKVPIIIKRHKANIIVSSKLVLKENNEGISVNLWTDFTKYIIYSLLIGTLPSLLFLFLYSSMELFIIFSILISLIILRMFYINILKLSKEYLKEIKKEFI
jgi:hypothetical protein